MRYSKPPLSVSQQIAQLRDRGMTIADEAKAGRTLAYANYYRLSAYWLPFEVDPLEGMPRTHLFQSGTDFDKIRDLYEFDSTLRRLVMEAIERVEIAVRTHWASGLSLATGSAHAHLEHGHFREYRVHVQDLGRMVQEMERSNEIFVKHYFKTYDAPGLPPIWACVETMTLGALSRWIRNTAQTPAKKAIMAALALPTVDVLEAILHVLTPLRNICAHHARLWNRRFVLSYPAIRRLASRMIPPKSPDLQEHFLFNHLVVLDHLMTAIEPEQDWTARLSGLLATRSADEMSAMGFPADWRDREPWKGCGA